MNFEEKISKNEDKIKRLQEENKELLRKKKEQERREHLAYLENEDILLKEILGFQEEKISLDFLRYALDAMRENMKELWDEWREK